MSNTPSKVRLGSSQPSESTKHKRGMFQKDCEFFSSGNSLLPLPETVALVKILLWSASTKLKRFHPLYRGKLLTEDFLFLIRKDLPKLDRCRELLSMHEELKQSYKTQL